MSETVRPGDAPTRHPARSVTADDPSLRPLLIFAAVAVPTGWVALSTYQMLGLPQAPFVLATLLVGLIAPAVVLTAQESGRAGVRALFRDAVRLPRPLWWGPVAALALPGLVWAAAGVLGGAEPLSGALLTDVMVAFITTLLIVNIWEEMAWTGFVQRRAMARWGVIGGSLVTAGLFVAIHLPLAFDGADTASDVAYGVAVLVGAGVGLRLLIAKLDAWGGRSLLTVGILHASFNVSADLIATDYDWVRVVLTVLLGLAVVTGPLRRNR